MKYVKINLLNSGKYLGIQGPKYGVVVPEEMFNLMRFLGLRVELVKPTPKQQSSSNLKDTIKEKIEIEEVKVETPSKVEEEIKEEAEPVSEIQLIEEEVVVEEPIVLESEISEPELIVDVVETELKENNWYEYSENELLAMKRTELRALINKERGHERITDPYHATKDEAKASIINKIISEQEERKLKEQNKNF